jgi:hypothetical protein
MSGRHWRRARVEKLDLVVARQSTRSDRDGDSSYFGRTVDKRAETTLGDRSWRSRKRAAIWGPAIWGPPRQSRGFDSGATRSACAGEVAFGQISNGDAYARWRSPMFNNSYSPKTPQISSAPVCAGHNLLSLLALPREVSEAFCASHLGRLPTPYWHDPMPRVSGAVTNAPTTLTSPMATGACHRRRPAQPAIAIISRPHRSALLLAAGGHRRGASTAQGAPA